LVVIVCRTVRLTSTVDGAGSGVVGEVGVVGGVTPVVPVEVVGDEGSVDVGASVDGRADSRVGVAPTLGMTTVAFSLARPDGLTWLDPGGTADVPCGPPG
jgi:hypothetical protein